MMTLHSGATKPGGMTHFAHRKCWGKLKDAVTRCVLRPEDCVKMRLRAGAPPLAPLDKLTARRYPRLPSWIWRIGNWKWKR